MSGVPGTAPPAVRVRDAVFAYGDHVALRVEDLVVPRDTVTAVIGPNGSGKSTLLSALSGLLRPARGTVETLGGRPRAVRRQIAHVLQETAANEVLPLTVREVVAMGRYARRGPLLPLTRADRAAIAGALTRVGLDGLENRHLRELSGGQRQRVYVAQGLAQEADLLLLDEPASGLDLPAHRRLIQLVREEQEAGRAVVFTTHDVGEATAADLVVVLAGHVVAVGPPADVLTTELLTTAYGGHAHVTPDGAVVLDDPHHHRREHPRTQAAGRRPPADA